MANRLVSEPSLHLRQHGADPVDWYPWGEPALQRAREGRLPILLCIGYAASHACHRMQRESFADAAIADLLNRRFLPVLVDRDQQPEIDRVYQLTHLALQQEPGGWPLIAVLDADSALPLFIGSYFPAEASDGLPAFRDVLSGIAEWAAQRPDELVAQLGALQQVLSEQARQTPWAQELDDAPLREAERLWLEHADTLYGGELGAPKFAPVSALAFALRQPGGDLRAHADLTLRQIARGGLHDLLGGGFFRCCIDEHWGVPQFEKLLTDNALLLPLFAQLAATGEAHARQAAIGIVRWLQEQMSLPEGGFASAIDAESDGRDGDYYLWSAEQWRAALSGDDAELIAQHLGLDRAPNVGGDRWHLRIAVDVAALADLRGESVDAVQARLKSGLRRLQLQRGGRIAPCRDDCLSALGNGLALSGLARASLALQRADWLELAQAVSDRLSACLWKDGQLHARAYQGQPQGEATLDDYAALLIGQLDLLEARWRRRDLDLALELAEGLLRRFEDSRLGGFWLCPQPTPGLPLRIKPWLDELTPSGNALAAQALQRLGALLSEPRYLHAAERALRAAWSTLQAVPEGAAGMLQVLQDQLHPPPQLIARLGDAHEHARWQDALQAMRREGLHVFVIPAEESLLTQALEDKRWLRGGRVYWSEGLQSLPRFDSPIGLMGQRGAARSR